MRTALARISFSVACCVGVLGAAPAAFGSHAGTPDRDCADFSYHEDAQSYYVEHGGPGQDQDRLDADSDGQACDSLPRRGSATPVTPPASAPPADTPTPRKRETMRAVKVLSVVDGDTIRVRLRSRERLTVRLIGVDTPETRKPGAPVECGGRQATANLKRLAFKRNRGRIITLVTDPTQDRTDRFGRLLAYARVDSGRDLALEQIRAGWGMSYVYERPFERVDSYGAAQNAARGAERGVWGACGGIF